LKRTVEGDLGLRFGAISAAETGYEYVDAKLAESGLPPKDFRKFVFEAAAKPDYLPSSKEEIRFDEILAGACVYLSLRRHAGSLEETYTSTGKVFVQRGKSLRGVKKWIVSGGYLSRRPAADICEEALAAARRDAGKLNLLPEKVEHFADRLYILPLLGNLAEDFPNEAVRLAEENIQKI
jgi:uncharacterized protein (TIGR01319 family)